MRPHPTCSCPKGDHYTEVSLYHIFCLSLCSRVLDIEPDSEDEDAILERRRQLRRAIEEKYEALKPPQLDISSMATSPAKSGVSSPDSDLVGLQATK